MKENIIKAIQAIILFGVMTIGFLALFGMVWIKLGFPINWWSGILVSLLSATAEFFYFRWVYWT
jgi:hypothetical protein